MTSWRTKLGAIWGSQGPNCPHFLGSATPHENSWISPWHTYPSTCLDQREMLCQRLTKALDFKGHKLSMPRRSRSIQGRGDSHRHHWEHPWPLNSGISPGHLKNAQTPWLPGQTSESAQNEKRAIQSWRVYSLGRPYTLRSVVISRSGRACVGHASADMKTTAWLEVFLVRILIHHKSKCLCICTAWERFYILNQDFFVRV